MLEALSHERPDARREAALTLGRIARSDPAVTEALKTLSNDEDPTVRQAAEQALRGGENR